jgi:hypothetical protein
MHAAESRTAEPRSSSGEVQPPRGAYGARARPHSCPPPQQCALAAQGHALGLQGSSAGTWKHSRGSELLTWAAEGAVEQLEACDGPAHAAAAWKLRQPCTRRWTPVGMRTLCAEVAEANMVCGIRVEPRRRPRCLQEYARRWLSGVPMAMSDNEELPERVGKKLPDGSGSAARSPRPSSRTGGTQDGESECDSACEWRATEWALRKPWRSRVYLRPPRVFPAVADSLPDAPLPGTALNPRPAVRSYLRGGSGHRDWRAASRGVQLSRARMRGRSASAGAPLLLLCAGCCALAAVCWALCAGPSFLSGCCAEPVFDLVDTVWRGCGGCMPQGWPTVFCWRPAVCSAVQT